MLASPETRTLAALMAVTLLLTGAAPLAMHLCGMGGDAAEASAMERTCCPADAPDRCQPTADAPASAPAMAACCTDAPAELPAEGVVIVTPVVPELWAAVAPLAAWPVPSATPAEHPRPRDAGPPGPALRPHLAFSVLLI